jgi:RNA polymerase sigma factor (sigma-70 family)
MSDQGPNDQPESEFKPDDNFLTHASLFGKLREQDTKTREQAWTEFCKRYKPMIGRFAAKVGAKPSAIDDIVQDVTIAFWADDDFAYDPAKGRFRSWLKTTTVRIAIRLQGKAIRINSVPLEDIPHLLVAVEPLWNDVWEQQLMAVALEELEHVHGQTLAYKAFKQYALLERSAEDVAYELETSADNVHQAKHRMTAILRKMLQHIRE